MRKDLEVLEYMSNGEGRNLPICETRLKMSSEERDHLNLFHVFLILSTMRRKRLLMWKFIASEERGKTLANNDVREGLRSHNK